LRVCLRLRLCRLRVCLRRWWPVITNSANRTNGTNEMGGKKDVDKVIHRDLSYRTMEAVFKVHNSFGPGFVFPCAFSPNFATV
jgi:hypothetical protein